MDDDDEIRAFLDGVPQDRETVPGRVVIYRAHVEEWGGDNAAVHRWVQRHEGVVKVLRFRPSPAAREEDRPYYEIPVDALPKTSDS
jgi:hypothetical protein